MLLRALAIPVDAEFASGVRAGLTREGQRELPSQYLYDDVGTALFDAITLLPEYGLTRADERLLRRHSPELAALLPADLCVAELGSGTGRKTRWVLETLRQSRSDALRYFPIDVSRAALDRCVRELAETGAGIEALEAPFLDGLREAASRRAPGENLLVLFLGSSIGNFELTAAQEFLRCVRACLRRGDALLLGTDLVKPVGDLLLAYDDPARVTAAFNLNLLARINRELGGNFILRQFDHEARYSPWRRRVEMHLCSLRRQTVSIAAAGLTLTLERGETIRTELSHKYRAEEPPAMAQRAGFVSKKQWIDAEWPFAENLWIAETG